MKLIPLTRGLFTKVDDEDFEKFAKQRWHAAPAYQKNNYYAVRGQIISKKLTTIYLHRLIMKAPKGKYIDHINGNGLDNRKLNLRFSTNQLNQANSKLPKNNSSGFKGVVWHKKARKWMAQIMYNHKHVSGGLFNDVIKAAQKYDLMAKELFGEFAKTNF